MDNAAEKQDDADDDDVGDARQLDADDVEDARRQIPESSAAGRR